jgi:two-component system, sensor histidine kinase and response regulator
MDVQMPEMDGYQTTRHIRSMPQLAGLRVIAMTANAMADDRQRCLSVGMDDFITKPFDPTNMYLVLAKWLSQEDVAHSAKASVPADPVATPGMAQGNLAELSAINLNILGSMVDQDPAKIRKFATLFVETAQEAMAEMDVAHADRDLQALGNLGHKMKSSATTVGALSYAELCRALEAAAKDHDWALAELLLPQLQSLLARIASQVEKETAE